ncbi:MAG: FHA domain-containing protein, partial [Planctomycetota bacterium]
MFPTWRLRLREARLAVDDGRWDDAAELLSSNSLLQYLPAKRLSTKLAGHLMQRAQQRIGEGESSAGWRDLQRAAALGADEGKIMEIRRAQSRRRLDRAIELLDAGDVASAAAELKLMEQRRLGANERTTWQRVAELLVESQRRAERGDVAIALSSLVKAQDLIPGACAPALKKRLEEQRSKLRDHASRLPGLDAGLHAALAERNWTAVLAAADALLEMAPHHSAARRARRQAWKEVGMEVTQSHHGRRNEDWIRLRPQPWPAGKSDSTHRSVNNAQVDTVTYDPSQHRRLVAWIDAVGGYLICLGDEITLGQPSNRGEVDIPILADLSRRHATIRREGESYVLKPIHDATIDGVGAVGPVVLRDKSVIGLGD